MKSANFIPLLEHILIISLHISPLPCFIFHLFFFTFLTPVSPPLHLVLEVTLCSQGLCGGGAVVANARVSVLHTCYV